MTQTRSKTEPPAVQRTARIHASLEKEFNPILLNVTNDSARHRGHAGASPQEDTHYNIEIAAAAFKGLSRVQAQRLIYKALAEEFETGLHALSIQARAQEAG